MFLTFLLLVMRNISFSNLFNTCLNKFTFWRNTIISLWMIILVFYHYSFLNISKYKWLFFNRTSQFASVIRINIYNIWGFGRYCFWKFLIVFYFLHLIIKIFLLFLDRKTICNFIFKYFVLCIILPIILIR